jgi:hypothetical protein
VPIKRHFGGHGEEAMSAMKRTYGDSETAKRVFYATENKKKSKKKAKKRASK